MTTDFQLRAALEALLLSAETPLNLVTMAGALEVPIGTVSAEIEALVFDYNQAHEGAGRGLSCAKLAGVGASMFARATTGLCGNWLPTRIPQNLARPP